MTDRTTATTVTGPYIHSGGSFRPAYVAAITRPTIRTTGQDFTAAVHCACGARYDRDFTHYVDACDYMEACIRQARDCAADSSTTK